MIELRHLRTLMALKESGSLAGAAKNGSLPNQRYHTKLKNWKPVLIQPSLSVKVSHYRLLKRGQDY